ncbi:MAG: ATP-binding protein [Pseudomonadota bacterium]
MSGVPVNLTELLALFPEPTAIFDGEDRLAGANAGFVKMCSAIPQFIRPGTPWNLFLAEAERKSTLSSETCSELHRLGELLLLSPDEVPPLQTEFTDGGHGQITLTALSDGGFAMRVAIVDPSAEGEREIEQVMAKVLEACPTSLTMARIGDGQILYRSPSATDLLGKGMNSYDHFARREERADFVTALLPDARVDDMRITGRKGDGSEFPAAISARLIDYRGEDVAVYSILNLSDEIALQSELARQRDLVFRTEKMSALGELLAGVAHELNNPLSIVVGNMLILQEEDMGPSISGRVNKVADAAERCVRIVRSFLAMAREKPLELTAVPVSFLADTAVDSFLAGEQGAKVDLMSEVPATLPDLWVDETQIVQVLTNLIVNASQAIVDSGIGSRVTLSAKMADQPNLVRIVVEDDGPGVPADLADKVFDPLFTTKAAGKGTGVGLALCNRIVVSHGGSIHLDQQPSVGARFVLDLPIHVPTER